MRKLKHIFSILSKCCLFYLLFCVFQAIGTYGSAFVLISNAMNSDKAALTLNNISSFYMEIVPENMQTILCSMEVVSTIGVVCLCMLYFGKDFRYIFGKFHVDRILKYIMIGAFVYAGINIFVNIMPWPESWISQNRVSTGIALSGESFILTLISTGVLAPFCEELLFRGIIYDTASSINKPFAILVSSIMFGVAHGNALQCTYAIMLAVLFCCINHKNKGIMPSVLLHMIINSSSVFMSKI